MRGSLPEHYMAAYQSMHSSPSEHLWQHTTACLAAYPSIWQPTKACMAAYQSMRGSLPEHALQLTRACVADYQMPCSLLQRAWQPTRFGMRHHWAEVLHQMPVLMGDPSRGKYEHSFLVCPFDLRRKYAMHNFLNLSLQLTANSH